jgi:hypothetical protein
MYWKQLLLLCLFMASATSPVVAGGSHDAQIKRCLSLTTIRFDQNITSLNAASGVTKAPNLQLRQFYLESLARFRVEGACAPFVELTPLSSSPTISERYRQLVLPNRSYDNFALHGEGTVTGPSRIPQIHPELPNFRFLSGDRVATGITARSRIFVEFFVGAWSNANETVIAYFGVLNSGGVTEPIELFRTQGRASNIWYFSNLHGDGGDIYLTTASGNFTTHTRTSFTRGPFVSPYQNGGPP